MTSSDRPGPGSPGSEFVDAARRLARDVLTPAAEQVDAEGVPPGHVEALKAAGLLGVTAPTEYGGGGAPAAVGREVTEVLSGACGASWFVATQHATPLRTVLASGNEDLRASWLRPLASSALLAGIAVSHLRRAGPPPVTVTPVAGGWRYDGRVDWVTSWGLAEVVLLGGVTPDGEVVAALVPAAAQPGLTPSGELRLAAMGGAHNVALRLDGLVAAPEQVALRQSRDDWLANDRLVTANVTPAVFGLLGTVLRRLAETSTTRRSAAGSDLAAALTARAGELRTRGYQLLNHEPPEAYLPERLAIRAAALELLNRAATALIVAGAGTSMLAANPAQRLAREALFHLVQASTPALREAVLGRISTG